MIIVSHSQTTSDSRRAESEQNGGLAQETNRTNIEQGLHGAEVCMDYTVRPNRSDLSASVIDDLTPNGMLGRRLDQVRSGPLPSTIRDRT